MSAIAELKEEIRIAREEGREVNSLELSLGQYSEGLEEMLPLLGKLEEILGLDEVRISVSGELDPDVLRWSNAHRWRKRLRGE